MTKWVDAILYIDLAALVLVLTAGSIVYWQRYHPDESPRRRWMAITTCIVVALVSAVAGVVIGSS